MKTKITYLFLAGFLIYGCNHQKEARKGSAEPSTSEYIAFAERFTVETAGEYFLLSVINPWQNAGESEFTYLLGRDKSNVPDSLRMIPFIKTPVQRTILMSTTFIAAMDTLNELSSVCGISGTQYVYNEKLLKRISSGEVKDVGYDQGLNYEMIIELNPDVLFLYGVEAGITQTIRKLEDLGITVVICADYLETEPLGRAEWLKFFSLFFNRLDLGTRIFNGISEKYDSIRTEAAKSVFKPSVFVGLPWKDVWYIAGGSSFAASFIEDAGGDYIWRDLKTTEAEPYDLESVFSKIMDADIWINPGVADNLQSIIQHDQRFEILRAFQNGKIYNNNRRTGIEGGNDYWESGILKPDVILNDLVNIFHNGNDSLYFYKRLR